jgi:hypothetical protein
MGKGQMEATNWLEHYEALAEIGDLAAERMLDDRARVLAEHETVSDRIRGLHALGYQRTDIAWMLEKSYQHVRNVLVADAQAARRKPSSTRSAASPVSDPAESDASVWADVVRLRVRPDGSVLLPSEVLQRMGSRTGGILIANLQDGEMLVRGPQSALRHAQALAGTPWEPGEPMLSDELIADRLEEDRRERGR